MINILEDASVCRTC